MSVFEALMFSIAFTTLMLTINNKNKKVTVTLQLNS